MQKMVRTFLFCIGMFAFAGTAVAQTPWCYDQSRDTITQRAADRCAGRVVGDTEAKKIKAEIRKRRLQRMKQAMAPKPERFLGKRGHGTGFFVSPAGHIITNNHVIAKCKGDIWYDTTTGKSGTLQLIDTDKRNDLALLKGDIEPPGTAVFQAPANIEDGDNIIVIGYGTHTLAPIKPHLTEGLFQKINDAGTRFQMKAAVRPGNSGGPVLDAHGRVIGVVFAQLNTPKIFEKTGELILDRGFGITNPLVFRLLERHNVPYLRNQDKGGVTHPDIFSASKPFITRITCQHN